MYRIAAAEATTDTNLSLSARYTYTDDLLTAIQTPSTTYSISYGNFGLRTGVSIGSRDLATYTYTENNNFLEKLDYGNRNSVEYTYDSYGRVLTQTYEDGETVTYTYDNDGTLATVTDSATGRVMTYYYDFTGRATKYVETGTDYYHSVGYTYDSINNLTALVENINGTEHTTSYTYDDDNRVASVTTDGLTVTYTYDGFGRVTQKVTTNAQGATVKTESYTFTEVDGALSTQIATHTLTIGATSVTTAYTYDKNGNILTAQTGNKTKSYVYDSANQLIRENDQERGFTHTWTYDAAGNITSFDRYPYTTGELGTLNSQKTYAYNDEEWDDLLTSFNGEAATYDGIGNPTSLNGHSYTWEHGRQLASTTYNGKTWTYTYNNAGLRTGRTDGTNTYEYIYNGDRLTRMIYNGNPVDITYEGSSPIAMTYQGATYYFLYNLQGDITGITDSAGNILIRYLYEAYGYSYVQNVDPTLASLVDSINPFGYRGYVFDMGTGGLYYLQSRYYDPKIGRFINADALASTGQKFMGNNMLAYCLNNPVNCS